MRDSFHIAVASTQAEWLFLLEGQCPLSTQGGHSGAPIRSLPATAGGSHAQHLLADAGNAQSLWTKQTGAKLALKPFQVWGIRIRLQVANSFRDLALFDLALDCKLRGCDLTALKVSDLLSAAGVRSRVTILQRKTGRPVTFEVTQQSGRSIAGWIDAKGLSGDDWLFPSRSKKGFHITTRQYSRLVDKWVASIGLDPAAYGTHSMRRTKVSLLYKKTGNLRACQLLLGHTKLESTVRYLGVEVDDALELSESLEL